MAMTKDSFISTNTANYLASYSGGKTPEEIAEEILGMINNDFDMYNAAAAKGRKLKCMDKLLPVQIADIILALHNVAAIKIADTEDGYILAFTNFSNHLAHNKNHPFFLINKKDRQQTYKRDIVSSHISVACPKLYL